MSSRRPRPPFPAPGPDVVRRRSPEAGRVLVGISGWRYPTWRNVFYPKGLRQRSELAHASRQLRTIEINGSFYSLQHPTSYRAWAEEVPEGFVFALKGGRFITHNKKLRDCEAPLANFFASGPLALEDKLGPILWQLPPQLGFDRDRIENFLALLPRDTGAAVELARLHDARLKGRAHLETGAIRPIRYAVEVRHPSFVDRRFLALLRRYEVAVCVADTAGRWPLIEDVTADFVYVRLHGSRRLYASGYSSAELDEWAAKIDRWRAGRDVYVYFDNDVKVRAPFDAMNLAARFGEGERVRFPRKLHREAEAARGVEEVRQTWERWTMARSSRASARSGAASR
jgi:uncharacterized protein YecE (DUF72 family)